MMKEDLATVKTYEGGEATKEQYVAWLNITGDGDAQSVDVASEHIAAKLLKLKPSEIETGDGGETYAPIDADDNRFVDMTTSTWPAVETGE